MDGGSFRGSRPADGRVINRQGQAAQPRQPEEPQTARVESEPTPTAHRPNASFQQVREEKPKGRRFGFGPIIIAVAILLVGFGAIFTLSSNSQSGPTGIDGGKYQAVFFTNGQVYFGKLKAFSNEYLKLTDVFYLQTQAGADAESENPQKTSADQGNVQLIKLGNEIHGPQDEMIISKDQVLFYENLKDDGNVAQSIKKYKDAN